MIEVICYQYAVNTAGLLGFSEFYLMTIREEYLLPNETSETHATYGLEPFLTRRGKVK